MSGFLPLALTASAGADPSAADWSRLRMCESSGHYTAVAANGHYGAYQFDLPTWRSVGGSGLPSEATSAEQDYRALALYRSRGWQPGECAGILGLRPDADARSGRPPALEEATYISGEPAGGVPAWPGKVFAPGDCDPALRTWQLRMNSYGYGFEGTGCYAEKTGRAVLDLQRANGINDSGRLGPATWAAAWDGVAPQPPAPAPAPAPVVPAPAVAPVAPVVPAPVPAPVVPAPVVPAPVVPAPPVALPPVVPSSPGGTEAAVVHKWGPVVAGDEFGYTGPPDPAKWSAYHSVGHAGQGLRRPSAIRVDGSKVVVSGDANGTTGGMAARFDRRTHGRWEARMAVPRGDSEYHPVLILWPDSNNFPCEGEVDYAESTAAAKSIDFFLHYSCSNRQVSDTRPVDPTQPMDLTQWHNYAVEWTPSCVTGFLDGAQWFRDCTASHIPPAPMHQTIQLDYFPDATPGVTPSSMWVDWVRVYDL